MNPDVLLNTLGYKPTTTSITKRYYFLHTNKKDKKKGKIGYPGEKANRFYHACLCAGLRAEFTIFGEEGTGVEVTQRLSS